MICPSMSLISSLETVFVAYLNWFLEIYRIKNPEKLYILLCLLTLLLVYIPQELVCEKNATSGQLILLGNVKLSVFDNIHY